MLVCSSMSCVLSVVRTKATVMLCLCACVQIYELGAECGENEGDGDVVLVCSSMSWELKIGRAHV